MEWTLTDQRLSLSPVQRELLRRMRWSKGGNTCYRPEFLTALEQLRRASPDPDRLFDGWEGTLRTDLIVLQSAWTAFAKRFTATAYESLTTLTMARCLPAIGDWEWTGNSQVPIWTCDSRLCPWCSARRAHQLYTLMANACDRRRLALTTFIRSGRTLPDPAAVRATEATLAPAMRQLRRGADYGVKLLLVRAGWKPERAGDRPVQHIMWRTGAGIVTPAGQGVGSEQKTVTIDGIEFEQRTRIITPRQRRWLAVTIFEPPTALYKPTRRSIGDGRWEVARSVAAYLETIKRRRLVTGFGELRRLK